jgi:preprotein translocase subunit Sec63
VCRPWNEVLGISAKATVDDVHSAYRSKISQYHPDRVAGLGPELQDLAEQHSKDINRAYAEAQKIHSRS